MAGVKLAGIVSGEGNGDDTATPGVPIHFQEQSK